jgi:hypothetical protein
MAATGYAPSSLGGNDAAAKHGWDGTPGKPARKFFREVEKLQIVQRQQSLSRGSDIHSGEQMGYVQRCCPTNSEAELTIGLVLESLEDAISIADLGWFPPAEAQQDIQDLISMRHVNAQPALAYLHKQLQEKILPITVAANKYGLLCFDWQSATLFAGQQITPEAYHASFGGVATGSQTVSGAGAAGAAAPAAAAAAASVTQEQSGDAAADAAADAAVPAAPLAPAQQADSVAELSKVLLEFTRQQQRQPAVSAKQRTVSVKGRQYTPHSAVVAYFWIVMDALYGLASQQDLQEFWSLGKAGAQGSMLPVQFAQSISTLYEGISILGTTPADSDVTVFMQGLNGEKAREFANLAITQHNTSAAGVSLQLLKLAEKVQRFEQNERNKQLVQRQAALYADVGLDGSTGGSSSGIGYKSSKAAMGALQQAMLEARESDPKTQEYLRSLAPALRAVYQHAFDITRREPKNAHAVCLECRPTTKLHTVAECNRRSSSSSGKTAAAAMAAVSGGKTAAAAPSTAAGSSAAVTPAAAAAAPQAMVGSVVEQQMGNLQQQVTNLTALVAAGGLPRAYNRPDQQAVGGRQAYNRGGGSSSSGFMPCGTCGWYKGHGSQPCYCLDPNLAPSAWAGPSASTPEQGVKAYIERCVQQGLQLKLSKCAPIVQMLLSKGQLTPRAQTMARQALQQAAAAIAYGAAAWATPPMGLYQVPAQQPWPQGMQQAPAGNAGAVGMAAQQPLMLPAPDAAAMAGVQHHPHDAAWLQTPYGSSFAMVALLCEGTSAAVEFPGGSSFQATGTMQQLQDSSTGVGLIATRSATAQQHSPSSAALPQQPQQHAQTLMRAGLPRSFLPPPALPTDPNAMRVSGRQQMVVTGNTGGSSIGVEAAAMQRGQLLAYTQLQQYAAAQALNLEQLLAGSSTVADPQQEDLVAAMAAEQQLRAHIASKGLARITAAHMHSCYDSLAGPLVAATAVLPPDSSSSMGFSGRSSSGVTPGEYIFSMRLPFQPVIRDYRLRQSQRQTLDVVCSVSKEKGVTITFPNGREVLLDMVVPDSGSNTLIFTEAACKELGMYINRLVAVPSLKGISGQPDAQLIGRTGPFTLTLAKGSRFAATLPVPGGAFVMKGNAGGMYKVCLDKQTLLRVYGHVNPAIESLCWYPFAAQGDFTVMYGIPVQSAAPAAALMGGGLGAAGQPQLLTAAVALVTQQPPDSPLVRSVTSWSCDASLQDYPDCAPFRMGRYGTVQEIQLAEDSSDSSSMRGYKDEELPSESSDHSSLPDLISLSTGGSSNTGSVSASESDSSGWVSSDSSRDDISSSGSIHSASAAVGSYGTEGAGIMQSVSSTKKSKLVGTSLVLRCVQAGNWLLLSFTLLLLGLFDMFVDRPLLGLPSYVIRALTATAAASLQYQEPSNHVQHSQCAQVKTGSRRGRKKRRLCAKTVRAYMQQDRASWIAHMAAACNWFKAMLFRVCRVAQVLSARTVLLVLFCILSSLSAAAAMQVGTGLSAAAAGAALQQQHLLLPHGLPPQHTSYLLQQELANLSISRFRCYC